METDKEKKEENKSDLKGEIIEGIIPGEDNKIIEINKNEPIEDDKSIKISLKENEKNSLNNISNKGKENNINNIELNKDKENKIYESITGSIIGTPRQKYLVEYGSTKGYKRPNIKKGKDFTHNPKILIEGTISGIKKDPPPTLKSIFEENINDEIILNNNNSLKPSEYIISKFDIPEYLKKAKDSNISEASLKIDDNNFKINNESNDNDNSLELKNNYI